MGKSFDSSAAGARPTATAAIFTAALQRWHEFPLQFVAYALEDVICTQGKDARDETRRLVSQEQP